MQSGQIDGDSLKKAGGSLYERRHTVEGDFGEAILAMRNDSNSGYSDSPVAAVNGGRHKGIKAPALTTPRIDESKAWFRLEVRRSRIHRWGVFALEAIPARRRVIEYTGEKIDADEHARRDGKRMLYIFSLNDRWAVDPIINGSGAEYINHSCDGNLESHTYHGHIYLSSRRRIEPGEELSYDYNIIGDYNAPCRCGAEKCRGWLRKKGEG